MTPRPRSRRGFLCERCDSSDLIVVDSRWSNARGAIWRRRECRDCGHRKTYYESAAVATEPSSRLAASR